MSSVTSHNADTQFALARSLWQRGEVVQSEDILCELFVQHPEREDSAMLLAELLRSGGRLDSASQVVFDLCHEHDFECDLSLRGVQFIQQCHRQPLAKALCDAALARDSAKPALLAAAGNIERELGDFEKARSHYLAALGAGVDLNAWFVLGALAHTMRYADAGHPDFARFSRHFRNNAYSPRSRASAGFGLAKVYDDINDQESAACILRDANAMVRTTMSWDCSSWNQFIQSRKGEYIAPASEGESRDFVPIFVVGLPRSGTTLTATHLAMQAGARDRGELRLLRFIADQLIGGVHLDDPNALKEAAQLYRVHARQDDAPATYYIDQDPLNFRYLHLVEGMFPQARIIHCRRDSRDVALSLWCQDFSHPDCAFAYDLADIAHYAAGYDELMQHWRQQLSLPIFDVDYEAFVADPHGTLIALSDFIGVPGSQNVAASVATPINSASVWQARQPIYSSSLRRWCGYLPYVPELASFSTVENIRSC